MARPFTSLGADDDVLTIGLNRAVTLLAEAERRARRSACCARSAHIPTAALSGSYRDHYGPLCQP
jgi:topoisomerase IA-like protein